MLSSDSDSPRAHARLSPVLIPVLRAPVGSGSPTREASCREVFERQFRSAYGSQQPGKAAMSLRVRSGFMSTTL